MGEGWIMEGRKRNKQRGVRCIEGAEGKEEEFGDGKRKTCLERKKR